jgi:GDPmannose 4,6-dehydratase
MMPRRALICGVRGQDGSLLAHFLLGKGYEVWGSSRDVETGTFGNLERLGICERVQRVSMAPEDFSSVLAVIRKCDPAEVYFLSGQSSVGLSFEQPTETLKSIVLGTLNVLEACRVSNSEIRLYHAGSSECFGDTQGRAASEASPFAPKSPYAVAKASAHWLVSNYREAYGLFACTGILFNHESPLRPGRFVTQKIVQSARRISRGSTEKLSLGRLDIMRDWGWAPEYVDAMWRMLQRDKPDDYVVATGQSHTLETFVAEAFRAFDLNWREHVVQDPSLFRPTDILISRADPAKAAKELEWRSQVTMREVVQGMAFR